MANYYRELATYHHELKEAKSPQFYQCVNCGKKVYEVKNSTKTCNECVENVANMIDNLGI